LAEGIGCHFTTVAAHAQPAWSEATSAQDLCAPTITLPSRSPFLLAAAHFPDKSRTSEYSRSSYCREVAGNLLIAERVSGHQKTVLVGDLNMNPYEAGITGGLKAVITRVLAVKGLDPVSRLDTHFYNPMWQHFGETNDTPAGTYYRVGSEDEHYWNIYDQVLLRPALLPHFSDRDVHILTSAGNISLLTRDGVPRYEAISDHLPILFRLDI
jgi:endonuclease/exonuclease/phosphatase family metal-dependent hydrolase